MVWVILAPPPMNPMNPMMSGAMHASRALEQTIDDGDPFLLFLSINQMAQFGQEDKLAAAAGAFGITAKTSRLILTAGISPEGERYVTDFVNVFRWPEEHVIGKALQGQSALLRSSLPLELADDEASKVQTWPLLETSEDAWAETDWMTNQRPERDADEDGGPLVIAAAAERDAQRAVVIGNADMARNEFILREQMFLAGGGLETVSFVANPGNAELFVNSVYWLAGQEQLIAKSARSQDVRRFEPIPEVAEKAVWWVVLAGLPTLCLIGGGVVWAVRRK
jgi:hypothetical protein